MSDGWNTACYLDVTMGERLYDIRRFMLKNRNLNFALFAEFRALIDHCFHAFGCSHPPDSAERKIASIAAIFRSESSSGTGTSPCARIAFENKSP
jgi:hypothetical protein